MNKLVRKMLGIVSYSEFRMAVWKFRNNENKFGLVYAMEHRDSNLNYDTIVKLVAKTKPKLGCKNVI